MHQFIRTNEDKTSMNIVVTTASVHPMIQSHQKIVTFLCHHMHTYDYVCCHMVSPKVEDCSVC